MTPLILGAALFLHRGHLGFGLDLDLGQDRDDLVFYTIEHRREHLECLTLVLLLGIFLRITAQMNTLTQVVHGCQMLFPQIIQYTQ